MLALRKRRAATPVHLGPAAPDLTVTASPDDPAIPGPVRLSELLAPAGWGPHPGYIDHGNAQCSATLLAVIYPAVAHTGFMHRLLRAPVSRRFSFWIEPLQNASVVAQLTRDLEQHMASLRISATAGKPADPYVQQAAQEAQRLRDMVAQNTVRMYSLSVAVTLFAETPEALRVAVRRFKEEAAGALWVFRETWFQHGGGWRSTLPLARAEVVRPRRIDSQSLACTFPFTWAERIEPGGLYTGTNLQTNGPTFLALFDKRRYPAAHLVFVAQTRSGKSQTAKTLLLQSLLDPALDACVIDPSPPVDYGVIGQRLGRFVQIKEGAPPQDRWNVCAIEYPANVTDLDPEDRRLLTRKLAFLQTLIGLMVQSTPHAPGLTPTERALVEQTLRGVYAARGITDDLTSLIDPQSLAVRTPRMKPMPTLRDMVAALRGVPDLQHVALALQPYCQGGTADMFDGDQPPSALNVRFAVFNVAGLLTSAPHLQALAYLILGELIQQRMAHSGRRTVVVIDEAHILFSNADTALWVSRLFRMAAKLNSAVWLLTQSISDMVGEPGMQTPGAAQARVCLNNTYLTWLGHAEKDNELQLLAQQFHLTGSELGYLKQARAGDGLWIAADFHVMTHMEVPPALASLVSSTAAEQTALRPVVPDPLGGVRPLPA
jgi:hypothetical protein